MCPGRIRPHRLLPPSCVLSLPPKSPWVRRPCPQTPHVFSPGTWRPRRSIIFASWGAEEFGLIGSTEFTEVSEAHKGVGRSPWRGQQRAEAISSYPALLVHLLHRSSSASCRSARWPTSMLTSPCSVWEAQEAGSRLGKEGSGCV